MTSTTLMDQIRTIMIESDEKVVKTADLHLYLTKVTREEKGQIYTAMRDFERTGEVERVAKGKYKYIGKEESVRPIYKKMWIYLRAQKVITYEDLCVMTGASLEYAQEWVRKLEKRKIVKKSRDKNRNDKGQLKGGKRDNKGLFGDFKNDKIILIEDPVIMPVLDETSIKMKKIREKKKKEAMKAVKKAQKALNQVEIILGG